MSRLIVKNLPNKVTVDKLKDIFSEKGEITDVQLKYTKDGKFRNFGFIGFRSEEQAAAAKEYFDGTCINSLKINVEICANLGDEKKPRAWSKYASDSTAYKKLHENDENSSKSDKKKKKKIEKNKDKIKQLLKKHKDDPLFVEFIDAHVNDKTAWIKDALEESDKDEQDSGEDEENTEKVSEVSKPKEEIDSPEKTRKKEKEKVADKQISDLEYMKLLMKKMEGGTEQPEKVIEEKTEPKKVRNRPLLYIKITGLPYKCKKKDIKEFFRPMVPYSIRLPLGKGKKLVGFCYVGFRTEKELKKALSKDKLFIGNHRVHVHKYENNAKNATEEEEQFNIKKKLEQENNEESIGESGRIFVRNLPYIISEAEITSLFEKYGPLSDVNMPIDPILRQSKGFATITFMIPEHAVKAYSELDGTAFCGRMLHLLPARAEAVDDHEDDGLSFKEKKAKALKAQAKSSHNWNLLFLGANAVADVVASNYSTTKEVLLSESNTGTSAAVRLALGETQLVNETRAFLEENGVYLDAFNKTAKRRSKTCILVKNLPANTDKDEIRSLFERHGTLARFLLPKHGITALVDFIEPFEAKKAFIKLAYSQFKTVPLYLEWAPENVFVKTKPEVDQSKIISETKDVFDKNEKEQKRTKQPKVQNKETEESKVSVAEIDHVSEEIGEPEKNTMLFVKNLNFSTTESALKTLFASCGKLFSVTIAKKKDIKNPGQFLSMGYGFVQYYKALDANEALKSLQYSVLDGKTLELKRSEKENANEILTAKKKTKEGTQNGTKILVRNVPFQANRNELHEIFRAFGEIKTLRLPKKLTSDQHRGFGFVDYFTKADAKSAFEALCQSTHLYGRRLVLEWADQTDENEDISLLRKRTAEAFNSRTPGGKKSRKGAVDVETFVDSQK